MFNFFIDNVVGKAIINKRLFCIFKLNLSRVKLSSYQTIFLNELKNIKQTLIKNN